MPFGKWESFEDCVADFVSKGKSEELAKRICGALKARLEKEGVRQISGWEGEIAPHTGSLIAGKAIHPIKTFHSDEWPTVRVYLEEELQKAAGSLVGAPLLLDHVYPLPGKVLTASYADGAVQYVAELNDEQILDLIRKGVLKHCSVEYDWGSLEKVNGVAPRNIHFTGLALLKDFPPGDPQTSIEIWERITARFMEQKGWAVEEERFPLENCVGGTVRYHTEPSRHIRICKLEKDGKLHIQAVLKRAKEGLAPPDPPMKEGCETVGELSKQGDDEREEPRQSQRERAEMHGISPKEDRQPTKSEENKNLPEDSKKKIAGDEAEKAIEALQGQIATLTKEKRALDERVQTLEKEKADLADRLGEAVIDPSAEQIPDTISRRAVLEMIEAVIPPKQVVFSHGQTGGFKRLVDDIVRIKRKIERADSGWTKDES